jgi:hypothetical protein
MSELTSDLLTDALSLVHPDRRPLERQEIAKRVTARLSDLRPFVPEPGSEPEAKPEPKPADDKLRKDFDKVAESLARKDKYLCFDCSGHAPINYCDACRQEYDAATG